MYTIGIDIGKSFHVAAIMDSQGRFRVPSHKFQNSQEGFQSLLQKIRETSGKEVNEQIRIAIEATLESQIKEAEKAMQVYKEKLPAIQLLETMPGISFNLAATILGEIGDINKFKKADSLVAYAGMDTKVIQSGNFTGTKTKLSKRGSPYLRWAYACAAGVARIHDPALKRIFEKKQNQGKPYGIALTVVVHKMIHITYAILKQQKPYECHLPR